MAARWSRRTRNAETSWTGLELIRLHFERFLPSIAVRVALLGRPRLARDIDMLVDLEEDRWLEIVAAARPFDIEPRVTEPLGFARRTRVLLLGHGPSQIDIDVALGGLPFERAAVAAGQSRSLGDFYVRLPRVEDLMIM